jgi:hypothetical protein
VHIHSEAALKYTHLGPIRLIQPPLAGEFMKWISVSSSLVDKVAYDEPASKLYLQFKGNRVYAYQDVPREVFDDLIRASSFGTYFHAYIKDEYDYQRIR